MRPSGFVRALRLRHELPHLRKREFGLGIGRVVSHASDVGAVCPADASLAIFLPPDLKAVTNVR